MKGIPKDLNIRIRPNEVVVVRALDDDRYYRTVFIKPNPYTSGFQTMISNPVMGETPDGMREVSQNQVFKQMREMNGNPRTSTHSLSGGIQAPLRVLQVLGW